MRGQKTEDERRENRRRGRKECEGKENRIVMKKKGDRKNGEGRSGEESRVKGMSE